MGVLSSRIRAWARQADVVGVGVNLVLGLLFVGAVVGTFLRQADPVAAPAAPRVDAAVAQPGLLGNATAPAVSLTPSASPTPTNDP